MPEIDELRHEFFAAMGEAIAEWYWVELRVFYMLSRLIGFVDYDAAAAAYATNIGFNSRLGMADAALKKRVTDKGVLNQWKNLQRRIRKHSKKRNQLAHLTVYTTPQMKDPGQRVFLGDSILKQRPLKVWEPVHVLSDVQKMTDGFRKLLREFQAFIDTLPVPVPTPAKGLG